MTLRTQILLAAAVLVVPLSACTDNSTASAGSDGAGGGTIAVISTDDDCTLSKEEVGPGTVVFEVTNEGSEVTEFYLLSESGEQVVGEVENIGPGLTRNLVANAAPGKFLTACKPGMVGDGIRVPFEVTDS